MLFSVLNSKQIRSLLKKEKNIAAKNQNKNSMRIKHTNQIGDKIILQRIKHQSLESLSMMALLLYYM